MFFGTDNRTLITFFTIQADFLVILHCFRTEITKFELCMRRIRIFQNVVVFLLFKFH